MKFGDFRRNFGQIIADIKLMEKNNDMRLRAFICYGLNVQSLHRWMQVLRQNEVLSKKFFEPWSYVQSDHSMQELLQVRFHPILIRFNPI